MNIKKKIETKKNQMEVKGEKKKWKTKWIYLTASAEEKKNESENKAMETIQTDVTGGKKA